MGWSDLFFAACLPFSSKTMDRYRPPTRVLLISHAATREQREGIFPGDEVLTERMLAEVAATGWTAPAHQQVWTAPEMRARGTAGALGLRATEVPELREVDCGRWRGCALERVGEAEPGELRTWLRDVEAAPHGGEPYAELLARAGRWMRSLEGAGGVIAVTHASVVRACVVYAMGAPREAFRRVEIGPLTATDLRQGGDGGWTVRSVGVPLGR